MSFAVKATGHAASIVDAELPALTGSLIASGITAGDASLWGSAAEDEASRRLGWVRAVSVSRPLVPEITALRDELVAQGVTRVVLAGMGGSSLAPEVIAQSAGVPLVILDSTSPAQVLAAIDGDVESGGLDRTVLVVSSKSGSTIETDSARRAFEAAFRDLGIDPASRIVVVTDPDSPLAREAEAAGYRVFLADPEVGGRYSALTAFGLVPAGLAGVDIDDLLDEADATLLEVAIDAPENPALVLAAAIAGGGAHRRDKLGLVADGTYLTGLPHWIEQLVAESTGKDGTGILPVVLLPVSPELETRPADLQVVRFVDDASAFHLFERHTDEVLVSGSLGAQFVVWEYATAIAGRLLGINPFDQPDVESAKQAAAVCSTRSPRPPPPRSCSTVSRCACPIPPWRRGAPSRASSTPCGSVCPRTDTSASRPTWTAASSLSSPVCGSWWPPTPVDPPRSGGDRDSCTRPGNTTREGPRPACSSRSSNAPTSTSRSRVDRSRSDNSSRHRPRETRACWRRATAAPSSR